MAYCAYCGTQVPEVSYKPCSTCGNPTNGAPKPAMPTGGSNAAMIVIAVVIGGLVIVAIIGILAAIAIPNLLTAMQRSKQKRSMADLRSIAVALEARATDVNSYPPADSFDDLTPILTPTYIKALPTKDGWTNDFRYECEPTNTDGTCNSYFLGSAGKDKAFEHPSLKEYAPGATTRFDCDLIFSNGAFVQYPEGVQAGGQ